MDNTNAAQDMSKTSTTEVFKDFAASLIPGASLAKSIAENQDVAANIAEATAIGAAAAAGAGVAGKIANEGVKGMALGAKAAIQVKEKTSLPALEVVSGTVAGGVVGGGIVLGKWAGEQVINNLPQIKNTIKDGYKYIGNGIDAMIVPTLEK